VFSLSSSAQAEEGEDGEHDDDQANDVNDVVHESPLMEMEPRGSIWQGVNPFWVSKVPPSPRTGIRLATSRQARAEPEHLGNQCLSA
jgi:hypothetical protein